MVIGIVGAGLSGLVAGRALTRAGHQVIVFEKEQSQGGNLASKKVGKNAIVDYGTGYFTISTPEFQSFADELEEKDIISEWTDHFGLYDGAKQHDVNPNRDYDSYYTAPNGMNEIIRYLSRWVDIKLGAKVGGLTHIGGQRSKKKSWILNLTDFSVVEVDAVIIATPAVEAYGLIHMTQDETPSKKITRVIDEVSYHSSFALMYGYSGKEIPDWNALEVNNDVIAWISNEASKRGNNEEAAFVAQSTDQFARQNQHRDESYIIGKMEEELQKIFKNDYHFPEWRDLHYWKYARAKNPIDDAYFMEMEMQEAPLSLIGNYFKDITVETAYLSGLKLAEHWIKKYRNC